MARINIELPDNLHNEAKLEATRRHMTLKKYVITTLSDDLGVENEKTDKNQDNNQ